MQTAPGRCVGVVPEGDAIAGQPCGRSSSGPAPKVHLGHHDYGFCTRNSDETQDTRQGLPGHASRGVVGQATQASHAKGAEGESLLHGAEVPRGGRQTKAHRPVVACEDHDDVGSQLGRPSGGSQQVGSGEIHSSQIHDVPGVGGMTCEHLTECRGGGQVGGQQVAGRRRFAEQDEAAKVLPCAVPKLRVALVENGDTDRCRAFGVTGRQVVAGVVDVLSASALPKSPAGASHLQAQGGALCDLVAGPLRSSPIDGTRLPVCAAVRRGLLPGRFCHQHLEDAEKPQATTEAEELCEVDEGLPVFGGGAHHQKKL